MPGRRPISGRRPEIGEDRLKIDVGLTGKIQQNGPETGICQRRVFSIDFSSGGDTRHCCSSAASKTLAKEKAITSGDLSFNYL